MLNLAVLKLEMKIRQVCDRTATRSCAEIGLMSLTQRLPECAFKSFSACTRVPRREGITLFKEVKTFSNVSSLVCRI